MSDILDQIINDQSGVTAIPKDNTLEKISNLLVGLDQQSNQSSPTNDDKPTDINQSPIPNIVSNPSTYENILSEIQEHEVGMQQAIQEADELAVATKQGVMEVLKISNNRRHGILIQGVPDALNAAAKLLDLSINGRYKLASMKKLRASILKDMNSNSGKSDGFDLMELLSESDD